MKSESLCLMYSGCFFLRLDVYYNPMQNEDRSLCDNS